ncbi:MAG: hypothetical protein M3P50_05555 [Actinomycetota bacterium]|nr:hypothetical protein [Actinomycetota bacterium]
MRTTASNPARHSERAASSSAIRGSAGIAFGSSCSTSSASAVATGVVDHHTRPPERPDAPVEQRHRPAGEPFGRPPGALVAAEQHRALGALAAGAQRDGPCCQPVEVRVGDDRGGGEDGFAGDGQHLGPMKVSSLATLSRCEIEMLRGFDCVQRIPSRSQYSQKRARMSSERFEKKYRG